MFVQSKMVTILLMIVHGCIAVTEEFENCDRVQFSLSDQTGKDSIQNFTKQPSDKNGKSVYFSVFRFKKKLRYSVIWWNKKNNKWLSQTKRNYTHLLTGNKITKANLKIFHQNVHIIVFLK